MPTKTLKILLIVFISTFNCFGQDDFIENGLKGIKPLKTAKVTVERILENAKKTTKFGRYNYETDKFLFNVEYSDSLCSDEGGRFDVTLNTVLKYRVVFLKDLNLKDLRFQRDKYIRQLDREYNQRIYYFNRETGITIITAINDGIEYVGQILFDPSQEDKKKYACNIVKSPEDKPQESKPAKKADCIKPK